jgi:hypothetical protein
MIESSSTNPALASFATSIMAAAAAPFKQRAPLLKALLVSITNQIKSTGYDISDATVQAMLELLCDLILSPGTKVVHKPLLGQLKLLLPLYLDLINTYISTRYSQFISLDAIDKKTAESADKMCIEDGSKNSVDVICSLESLLLFPEFRPCTTPCFAPLLSYVVDLLEESVARALHAVGDCGAVGGHTIQTVGERVCVILAMLRDCRTNIISSTTSTINESTFLENKEDLVVEEEGIVLLEAKEEEEESDNEQLPVAVAVCRAADCLFQIMQQGALPKECMASAAIALCTAFKLPKVESGVVAADIAAGLLMGSGKNSSNFSPAPSGWVDEYLVKNKNSSIRTELQKLKPLPALCMLRGYLQSTPTADLVAAVFSSKSEHVEEKQNFLTDGVVCTLCTAIDASVDPKFQRIALKTLLVCVEHLIEQWKDQSSGGSSGGAYGGGGDGGKKNKKSKKNQGATISESTELSTNTSSNVSPSPKVLLTSSQQQLLLRVLWQSWDDTTGWREAYEQFGQLLTLVGLQEKSEGEKQDSFYVSVAKDLLALGPEQKRRYSPLAALVPHVGAVHLIRLHPNLVEEIIAAMAYNAALTSPASLMLTVLWSKLWEETSSGDEDIAAAKEAWQQHWVLQITEALCSTDEATRKVAIAYALPAVAEIEPKALEILFCEVAVKATDDVVASAVVGLLSAGRKLNLIQNLHSFCASAASTTTTGAAAAAAQRIDISALLHLAVTHQSDALRSSALQLVCIHPRTTELPTAEELELVQEALNMDMHTTSSYTRQNTIPPLGRLLARIRIASAAILSHPKDFPAGCVEEVKRCELWLQRFSAGLVANCYPRAQYARKYMAVDILCMLLEVYGDLLPIPKEQKPFARSKSAFRRKGPLAALRKGDGAAGASLTSDLFQPFSEDFYQPSIVNMLLGCVIDSWDKVRESAAEALLLLPAPLPGLDTPKQVQNLLQWGLRLLSNPKLKSADAGARILLLVFQHFVVGSQGWRIGAHPAVVYQSLATHSGAGHNAVLDFLATMVSLISSRVDAGEADLTAASRESLAHGPLLALRYILPFVPWVALLSDPESQSSTQAIADRLLIALKRLNNLVLPILSMPEEMTRVGAADVEAGDYSAADDDEDVGGALLGPEAQVITSACWMNAKELALVIGTLCQVAPITSSSFPPLLPRVKLASAGELLIRILVESKHTGVVDKTQPSLEVFAAAVMGAPDSSSLLSELPLQWLTRLINHINRPGQTRRDIIRRSSGLPYAIQALLRAKPEGGARMLATRGFEELFATASAENLPECWPRVHAFNALRMAFSDTEILLEAGAFHSQGLQISITALAAPEWEVRNAAMLCFTTLIIKVLGFANVATRSISSKRAVTAAEFFAMHPSLHPFLLAQLQRAAEELEAGSKDLHPSLLPILTLLVRLKPDISVQPLTFASRSVSSASSGGPLFGGGQNKSSSSAAVASPAAFIPLVQRCAAARPMAIRQHAAKALVPLVPAESIAEVAGDLATEVSISLRLASTLANNQVEWNANVVQGQLLQLVELVHMVAENRDVAAVQSEALLSSVATPLKSCAAVCTLGRFPCPPLSHAFLRLVGSLAALILSSFGDCKSSIAESFVQIASKYAWQGVVELSEEGFSNQIMSGVALKEATLLRLLWTPLLFSSSQQNWVDEVTVALQHGRSEVRSAALKAALRLLGNGNLPGSASATAVKGATTAVLPPSERTAFCAVLGVHITKETHEKSLRRTLHVLSLLLSQGVSFDGKDSAALLEFFAGVAHHAQHAPDPVTRRYALISLGSILHSSGTTSTEEVGLVAALGTEFSSSDQISELRLATVAMLGSSGLLQCPNTATSPVSDEISQLHEYQIAAWDAIETLLEDEDSDVREAAAAAAGAAMEGWEGVPPRTVCVEKVHVAVLNCLAARLGPVPALLRMLCRRICDVDRLHLTLKQILDVAKEKENGVLAATGRLFEVEADNLHLEPLLTAQLAAQALAELAATHLVGGAPEAAKVLAWGRQAAIALRDAIKTCPQGWQGITGFDSTAELEAAFFPVYCLVLAMWAAGHCSRGNEGYRGEIKAIINEINKRKAFKHGLGGHPLLRAAWSATVRVWLNDDKAAGKNRDGSASPTVDNKRKLLWKPTYFLPDIMPLLQPWELNLLVDLGRYEKAAAQASGWPSFHCTIS